MSQSRVSLCVLGGTELRGIASDAADRLLGQSKTVAFLTYLALAPSGRYQRRDRLVGLLWPELDQTHARAALRKAVHATRSGLGESILVTRGDEEVMLAPDALSCDAVQFCALADAGQFMKALRLYRGDLLEGFHLSGCSEFDIWLDGEREAMRERAAAVALALSHELAQDEQLTDAGVWARRAARFSWTDERVLRRALAMLERVGDRAGALRLYEDFARRLRQELDAQPSAETLSLVATLRG